MEKNLKNFITTVINTVDMFEEAKKALLTKVQVKSTHYYKGQLVLDIEYDAYWASCWFDTSAGIREHTGINLSEVYEDTEPEYFNK